MRKLIAKIAIAAIRCYQWVLAPLWGPCCRFYPTCSNYAIDAIRKHGVLPGARLSLMRLLKCNPFHPGGVDPVP